jgi:hypothetical protein
LVFLVFVWEPSYLSTYLRLIFGVRVYFFGSWFILSTFSIAFRFGYGFSFYAGFFNNERLIDEQLFFDEIFCGVFALELIYKFLNFGEMCDGFPGVLGVRPAFPFNEVKFFMVFVYFGIYDRLDDVIGSLPHQLY